MLFATPILAFFCIFFRISKKMRGFLVSTRRFAVVQGTSYLTFVYSTLVLPSIFGGIYFTIGVIERIAGWICCNDCLSEARTFSTLSMQVDELLVPSSGETCVAIHLKQFKKHSKVCCEISVIQKRKCSLQAKLAFQDRRMSMFWLDKGITARINTSCIYL